MALPQPLINQIEQMLGRIVNSTPISGGDISQAEKVQLENGQTVLVKWRNGPPPGIFTAERQGLILLRSTNTLRIPQVLSHNNTETGYPGFIVMEWLGRGSSSPQVAEALGQGLAQLHQSTVQKFGLDHNNFIGANPQINDPSDNWLAFFGQHRLGYQMKLAAKQGLLSRNRANLLEKLLARLGDWLPSNPPASLLHGDLWGGNWLTTDDGVPALIDPAVYYGHRETDIAFTELFGGFSSTFYAAYNHTWPLETGYLERKDLYNLYHLLNHLNLFGEGYGSGVDSILRRYVA